MRYLRYLLYFIIVSVAFYYVSIFITHKKSVSGMVIGLIMMFLIAFPIVYLEFVKIQKK